MGVLIWTKDSWKRKKERAQLLWEQRENGYYSIYWIELPMKEMQEGLYE